MRLNPSRKFAFSRPRAYFVADAFLCVGPPPYPPPQGGRGNCGRSIRFCCGCFPLRQPPTLPSPTRGEGVFLPLRLGRLPPAYFLGQLCLGRLPPSFSGRPIMFHPLER